MAAHRKPTKREIINGVQEQVLKGKATHKDFSKGRASTLFWNVKEYTIRGKPYMGHGSWDRFLEKEIGVIPLAHMPNDRLNHYVREQLKTQSGSSVHWQHSKEPVTPTGQSLYDLYMTVFRRKKRGKPYMGHGSWYDYLKKEIKAEPLDHLYMPDERLLYYIKTNLEKGEDVKSTHWAASKEPVTPTGHSLSNLLTQANSRRKRGKTYFGYGSWADFIREEFGADAERFHKTIPKTPARFTDEEIHAQVASRIQKEKDLSVKHWTQKGQRGSDTLRQLYSRVARRKKGNVGFFGYGSWRAYLTGVHGVSPLDSRNMTNERVRAAIRRGLDMGLGKSMVPWKKEDMPLDSSGHSPRQVYSLAYRRDFLGHGSWPALVRSLE